MIDYEIPCMECGKAFFPTHHLQKFCSSECRAKRQRASAKAHAQRARQAVHILTLTEDRALERARRVKTRAAELLAGHVRDVRANLLPVVGGIEHDRLVEARCHAQAAMEVDLDMLRAKGERLMLDADDGLDSLFRCNGLPPNPEVMAAFEAQFGTQTQGEKAIR